MSTITLTQTYHAKDLTGKPFIRRLVAFLIDYGIIIAVQVLVIIYVLLHFAIAFAIIGRDFELIDAPDLVYGFIDALLFFGYYIVFEWLYGATPGKLLLGMHVVKMDGGQCDIKAAVARALFLNIDTMLFGLLAYLSMRPPLYRRIGDRVAGTIVVNRNEVLALLPPFWWFLVATAVYLMITTLLIATLVVSLCRII
ncbi:RDD family protein [Roseiflexus sp.]|uniref:RDD family protein n=1 Tax=Roseiflexus sp. TaxID=2562120 RepID=UPI00398AB2DC